MKDVPRPPSYGSVYVPPHHRLRSVITSPNTSTSPVVVNNNTNNSFANASHVSNNISLPNSYPYVPPHQQHQKMKSQVDGTRSQLELSVHSGASTSDIDAWKRKLTTLLHSKNEQELVSREKKDRRDYERIAALATRMGLYSHLYAKVLVVSKVPLPNYRFDLDDKRPQREVSLPPGLQGRVDAHLREYLKVNCNNAPGDNLFSRTGSNGSLCTDEGLFEQPELGAPNQVAMERVLQLRSVQLRTEQQAWQVQ